MSFLTHIVAWVEGLFLSVTLTCALAVGASGKFSRVLELRCEEFSKSVKSGELVETEKGMRERSFPFMHFILHVLCPR